MTTKLKAGGTGLGLIAVLDRVNALCGFIDVTSRQNQRTRFDIYLPRAREAAVDLSLFYPRKKAPLGKGEVIAIMEADRTVLETYEDKVAALGYAPLGFQSLEAFKTSTANNQPDLIMLRAQSLQACQDSSAFIRGSRPCRFSSSALARRLPLKITPHQYPFWTQHFPRKT